MPLLPFSEALGAVRDFAAAVAARPLPQLPRDLPQPHPVWGAAQLPPSNAQRQALLSVLLSAGGWGGVQHRWEHMFGSREQHPLLTHAYTRRSSRWLLLDCLPALPIPPEVERLAAWADPLDAASVPPSAAASLSPAQWATHVRTAWAQVSPRLAVAVARRFPGAPPIREELQRLVVSDAGDPAVQGLPEAAPLLATPSAAKANAPQLQHLATWAPLPLLEAIALAAGPAGHHTAVLAFVARSLDACKPEEVAFFLPQLMQVKGGCMPCCVCGGDVDSFGGTCCLPAGGGRCLSAVGKWQGKCGWASLCHLLQHPRPCNRPVCPRLHPPFKHLHPCSCCVTIVAAWWSASCWTPPPVLSTLPTCWSASYCLRARRRTRPSTRRCAQGAGVRV